MHKGPGPLKGPFDKSGFPVGCKSACFAGLGGPICESLLHPRSARLTYVRISPSTSTADNHDCCTGSHNTAATCPPSGVDYYSYFKTNCPRSYAYAYDESSGTALFTCPVSHKADYTITFCP